MLASFNTIFQVGRDDIVLFLTKYLIGCLTLAWTTGITYMLIITLAVLQLREILHPDILATHIRPQETHSELLQSLVYESGLTHFRRLIVSLIVYLALLIVVLLIPIMITRFIRSQFFNQTSVMARLWYIIPEIQIPLEVTILHFSMLSILEGRKNLIGKVLFQWILFVTRKLKVTRFILPCPYKRHEGAVLSRNGQPVVGRPLRRPPPGWDPRNRDHDVYDNRVTVSTCALESSVLDRVYDIIGPLGVGK